MFHGFGFVGDLTACCGDWDFGRRKKVFPGALPVAGKEPLKDSPLHSGQWPIGLRRWGRLLCCMALVASDIYKLSADQLRQLCGAERLDCGGTVQALRQRIVAHLKAGKMATKATDEIIQTSAHQTGEGNVTPRESPNLAQGFHVNAGDSPVSVTTELLRQVPPCDRRNRKPF